MPTLTISADQDYSDSFLFQIDAIAFDNPRHSHVAATFAGNQFGLNGLADVLDVTGSAGQNTIVVNAEYPDFDASGWAFHAWQADDLLIINGTALADLIIGSSRQDVISGGNSNDTLRGGGGNDTISGGAGADRLSGGSGRDTLDYGQSLGRVIVDLGSNDAMGGDATGDSISGFENVSGGGGDDELTGSALSNRLQGGSGGDLLRGGAGSDRFVYNAAADSAGAGRDTIVDFSQAEGDRINLAAIDARDGGRDNAFVFRGEAAFSAAGQVRFEHVADKTWILADIDGDGSADLEIVLDGTITLASTDFIL